MGNTARKHNYEVDKYVGLLDIGDDLFEEEPVEEINLIPVYDFELGTDNVGPKRTVAWVLENEQLVRNLIKSKRKGANIDVEVFYNEFLGDLAALHDDFNKDYGQSTDIAPNSPSSGISSYPIRAYILSRLNTELRSAVSKYYEAIKNKTMPVGILNDQASMDSKPPHTIDSNSTELCNNVDEEDYGRCIAGLSIQHYADIILYYCREERIDIFKYISVMAHSAHLKEQNRGAIVEHEIAYQLGVSYAQYIRFRNKIRKGEDDKALALQDAITDFVKIAHEAGIDVYELSADKFAPGVPQLY